MDLSDFANGKMWAIREADLQAMIERLPEVFAQANKSGVSFKENPQYYDELQIIDGVGIVPVTGPITSRGSFYSFLYGGTPLTQLTKIFSTAVGDPKVRAVVFDFDTPGGTISGVDAFSEMVYAQRSLTPTVSFARGLMDSAGYWIGSAANRIISAKTADVGNIGVLMVHEDWSQNDAKFGLKRTIIKSGKYKALWTDAEPLSEFALQAFQSEIDYLAGLFVNDAAVRNRGLSPESLGDIAEAKSYIGQQAVDAGLADAVGNMDDAIAAALELAGPKKNLFYIRTGSARGKELKMAKEEKLTIETVKDLEAAVPALVEEIRTAAVGSVDVKSQVDAAVTAEAGRIIGLAMVQFGEEVGGKFRAVAASGITVEQFSAVSALQPPKQAAEENGESRAQQAALDALKAASAANPGSGPVTTQDGQDFMALVDQYQAQKQCKRSAALTAVASAYPDIHQKFLENLKTQGNA